MKRTVRLTVLLLLLMTAFFAFSSSAEGGVCYIGDNSGKTYATLDEAITAAASGDTIHLTGDTTFGTEGTDSVSLSKSVTVDGGGNTVTLNSTMQVMHVDLTLKDVTVKLNGKHFKVAEVEDGKASRLTLENGAVLDGESKSGITNGGAIETHNTEGTLEIFLKNGSVIKNCTPSHNGGAVYLSGGTLTMESGAEITNCSVTNGHGGAVKAAKGEFVINGGTINGCSVAAGNGGAIDVDGGTVKLSGNAQITENKKVYNGNETKSNIYLHDAASLTLTGSFTGSAGITLSSGGAAKTAFALATDGTAGEEKLYYDTNTSLIGYNDNGALKFATDGECYIGTDVYNRKSLKTALGEAASGQTITLVKDAAADDYSIQTIKTVTIDGKGHSMTLGDVMKVLHCDLTLKNVTVKLNGKHILAAEPEATKTTKLTLEAGAILDGESVAYSVNGGAIETSVANGGTLNIFLKNGSVIKNTSAKNGGAIFVNGGSISVENGAEIKNCKAEGAGGAFQVQSNGTNLAKLTISGGTISGCSAGTYGGGIKMSSGTLELSGNPVITGNIVSSIERNIYLDSADLLYLADDFAGSAGVNIEGLKAGMTFGTAKVGANGAEKLYSDTNKAIVGLNENGTLKFLKDGVSYIGTDSYNRMSLNDALGTVTNGDTVYLVKDAELSVSGDYGKTVTLNGQGKSITLNSIFTIVHGDVTFENVTVKLNGKHIYAAEPEAAKTTKLTLGEGAILDGEGVAYSVNGGAIEASGMNGGTAYLTLKNGSIIKNASAKNGGAVFVNGANMTMESGAEIKGCAATTGNGGAIVIQNNGSSLATVSIQGGTIKDCLSETGGGGIYLNSGTLELSGNTQITQNTTKGAAQNIYLVDASGFKVKNGFVGNVGITNAAEGTSFGSIEGSLKSTASVVSDTNTSLIAYAKEGKLYMIKKPDLTVTTDSGVYAKGAKGVIRAMSTFTNTTDETVIEACGTYFVKTAPTAGDSTKTSQWSIENVAASNGKGFQADLYGIDELTQSIVAVSWYKLSGVDEYIYVIGSAVTVDATNTVEYTEA